MNALQRVSDSIVLVRLAVQPLAAQQRADAQEFLY